MSLESSGERRLHTVLEDLGFEASELDEREIRITEKRVHYPVDSPPLYATSRDASPRETAVRGRSEPLVDLYPGTEIPDANVKWRTSDS